MSNKRFARGFFCALVLCALTLSSCSSKPEPVDWDSLFHAHVGMSYELDPYFTDECKGRMDILCYDDPENVFGYLACETGDAIVDYYFYRKDGTLHLYAEKMSSARTPDYFAGSTVSCYAYSGGRLYLLRDGAYTRTAANTCICDMSLREIIGFIDNGLRKMHGK